MVSAGSIRNAEDVKMRKEVGLKGEKRAVKILESLGFKEVRRADTMNSIYDITAMSPEGEPCIVEVRTRSPEAKTQFFTIRDTKIKNLKEIAYLNNINLVYFIGINKYGYSLFTIDQLITEKIPNVKIFKYKKAKAVYPTYQGYAKKPEKSEKLRIRCSSDTYRKFYVFVAEYGFKDQEAAIIGLLDIAEKNRSKAKMRYL